MPENDNVQAVAGSLPQDEISGFNRRRGPDRRKNKLRAFFCSFYMQRRHGPRRSGDMHDYYVDVHEPHFFYVVILTLGLCLADVYFTMQIINGGGQEANPVMLWLAETGSTRLFVGVKFFVTAAALVFLLAHKHFRFMGLKSAQLLYMILTGYMALIIYELVLLNRIYS